MRKVPDDARRAARGRWKSGEERGGVTKGEVVVVALINKINNPVNIKYVFLTIIVFFSLPGILTSQLYIM